MNKNRNTKSSKHYSVTAPYNFISLNDKVIETPEKRPPFSTFKKDHCSGYVECNLKNLTPLFIGDEKNEDDNSIPFFKIKGRVVIPGSSIRGLIRTMMEIVTWGNYKNFDNKTLYYRTFADKKKELRNMYTKGMSEYDHNRRKANYIINAGYLRKNGVNYYIQPAQEKFGKSFRNVSKRNLQRELKSENLVFKAQTGSKLQIYQKDIRKKEGYYVISGEMRNKKSEREVYPVDDQAKQLKVLQKDIKNYQNDSQRKAASLLDAYKIGRLCRKFPDGIPCFYIEWEDASKEKRISFGHTAMFRKAYERTIGNALPKALKDSESKMDFADSIFGIEATKNTGFSGRISFSDANLVENNNYSTAAKPRIAKTLLNPKPTCIQHYLTQPPFSKNHKMMTYNDQDSRIRGYKQFWHSSGFNWYKEEGFNTKLDKLITPVPPNNNFLFKVWFENLSKIELGALLFCLDLPSELGYKLGMGKPIGLGTIKIAPTLFITDRLKRYKQVFDFDQKSWGLHEKEVEKNDLEAYKQSFEKYIIDQLPKKDRKEFKASSLWEIDRMKQLKLMLNVNYGKKLEKQGEIEYMDLREFKNRNVLPNPDKV